MRQVSGCLLLLHASSVLIEHRTVSHSIEVASTDHESTVHRSTHNDEADMEHLGKKQELAVGLAVGRIEVPAELTL